VKEVGVDEAWWVIIIRMEKVERLTLLRKEILGAKKGLEDGKPVLFSGGKEKRGRKRVG